MKIGHSDPGILYGQRSCHTHTYRERSMYSYATDENWDVLKYETMANLFMGEGMSASNLSLDYALYLSLNTSA